MRVTEAARRERRNRVAAGDESAMLKLTPQGKGGKGPTARAGARREVSRASMLCEHPHVPKASVGEDIDDWRLP